jgi:hypothetical protein
LLLEIALGFSDVTLRYVRAETSNSIPVKRQRRRRIRRDLLLLLLLLLPPPLLPLLPPPPPLSLPVVDAVVAADLEHACSVFDASGALSVVAVLEPFGCQQRFRRSVRRLGKVDSLLSTFPSHTASSFSLTSS